MNELCSSLFPLSLLSPSLFALSLSLSFVLHLSIYLSLAFSTPVFLSFVQAVQSGVKVTVGILMISCLAGIICSEIN